LFADKEARRDKRAAANGLRDRTHQPIHGVRGRVLLPTAADAAATDTDTGTLARTWADRHAGDRQLLNSLLLKLNAVCALKAAIIAVAVACRVARCVHAVQRAHQLPLLHRHLPIARKGESPRGGIGGGV
jgi:hypothetical protein